MARILITDGEQRSSLAAVRSLGRAGHHVVVCSAAARPLAGASRYAVRTERVADPQRDPEAFAASVRGVLEAHRIDVLLPMTDTSVPLLLPLRDEMPGLVLPLPTREAYERASDKARLMRLAAEVGVPVPRQLVVDDPGARPARDDLPGAGPWVLKPARSAVPGDAGVLRFTVRAAGDEAELAAGLAAYPEEAYPVLVQERVRGPGIGVFLLAAGGRPRAAFGHRRIREKPPTGGVSVYRESVRPRPDVLRHAERLLEALGWTGVAMVEFKEDASTGTPYLMEVNGRFWGSLQLAIDAGVDFPRLLVGSALGEELGPAPDLREGIRSRWEWGDVDHLLWMLLRGSRARAIDPTLPGRLRAVGRFLVPWRPGDRPEVLRLDDPRPFLRESAQWVAGVLAR